MFNFYCKQREEVRKQRFGFHPKVIWLYKVDVLYEHRNAASGSGGAKGGPNWWPPLKALTAFLSLHMLKRC